MVISASLLRMVFDKPRVVKKPLMTVWCLEESEEALEETEKTSSGFLSSGRKADLSELELDVSDEEELEINEVSAEQSTEDGIESVTEEIKSEITLEDEFVQFSDSSREDYSSNSLDYQFEESQTSPIITLGLAATSSPRRMRASLATLPARIITPRFAARYSRPRQVERWESPPRRGLPGLANLNFLRVRENNYSKTGLIGPTRPTVRNINQSLFQTTF